MLANPKETQCINFAKQFYKLENFVKENPDIWKPENLIINENDSDGTKYVKRLRSALHPNPELDESLFVEPYEVLESKHFSKLWLRYGLVDQRIGPFITGPYYGTDITNCMQMWVRTLYNKPDFDVQQLEKEIQQRINKQHHEMLEKTPGLMVTMITPFEIIHREIDKLFGEYEGK